ncbi:hypothetical protein C7N43_30005 [Sphingobacteriales bacterium UPWRP_1]|nr:hypothetical protein BVG80_02755 [Sphingobacteriales bacterium TSM_CSM]PSJ73275.1 hypothetical protein C7N43_30005 [Sphingobacteriales bacterium UPWRP_1]
MTITFIIGLIVLGLLLIALEMVFIPGTTVAGILGIVLILGAILLSYYGFGVQTGNIVLLGSSMVTASLIFVGFKFFGAKGVTLDYKLNESKVEPSHRDIPIKIGDVGVALGDIKPQGNAIINSRTIVVRSTGEFIPDNTELEVIDVTPNRVIVKIRTS